MREKMCHLLGFEGYFLKSGIWHFKAKNANIA
jgi:hypothetical protein